MMKRIKAILFLFLMGCLLVPQQSRALSLDILGMGQLIVAKAEEMMIKMTEEKTTKTEKETHDAVNKKDKSADSSEFDSPDTLIELDDLSPIITLKEVRALWGEDGELNPKVLDVEQAIIKNYLINPDTLQENSEYLKGGSKEGEQMPDTSENPGTVRAQQKQYIVSLLRGQALARTLMLRSDKMNKTNKKLLEIVNARDSERELLQGVGILSTQTDYLMNNIIIVKAAIAEVEAMQSLQGQMQLGGGSGGGLGGLVGAIGGMF